jgi:class 3 adenylate cyclase
MSCLRRRVDVPLDMYDDLDAASEAGQELVATDRAATLGAPVRTFLIADIRDYTSFTQARGDDAAAELTRTFAGLARDVAGAAGGRIADCRGDEVLLVFESPRSALGAAVELQDACRRHTGVHPDFPLGVGVGIDAGEALPVENGFRGGALNLASRLCALADAGSILASDGVMHLARRVDGLEVADRGPVTIKGIEDPVRVFQIAREGQMGVKPRALRRAARVDRSQDREPARYLGIIGGCFGIAAFLLEAAFGLAPSGKAAQPVLAVAGCLLSFVGADRALRQPTAGTVFLLGAAILLAVALSWLSGPAVVLLLTGAGIAYFQRDVR